MYACCTVICSVFIKEMIIKSSWFLTSDCYPLSRLVLDLFRWQQRAVESQWKVFLLLFILLCGLGDIRWWKVCIASHDYANSIKTCHANTLYNWSASILMLEMMTTCISSFLAGLYFQALLASLNILSLNLSLVSFVFIDWIFGQYVLNKWKRNHAQCLKFLIFTKMPL